MNIKKLNKIKIYIGITLTLAIAAGIAIAALMVNDWYDSHMIIYRFPVEVVMYQPIRIEKRAPQVIIKPIVFEYPDEINTPIEKYICEKFGQFNCQMALSIARAESGIREEAVNINTNNTIDVGIYQINSVHFKKEGCSLKELTDQYKNVDCAYSIWKVQGWNPWVAYTTKAYLSHIE